jgi:hypothetical protein
VPIVELMSTYPAPWAICGGWAVDAWLGRTTRDHGDVDFCVWDQRALFEHLRDAWQMVAHHPAVAGDDSSPWDGAPVGVPAHIHARLDNGDALPKSVSMAAEQGFKLDIQLNECSGEDWTMHSNPRIGMPLRDAVQECGWGVPAVVPEVLLFYKSNDLRRRDRLDFAALRPRLSDGQRMWLREAIAVVGHPWLADLA